MAKLVNANLETNEENSDGVAVTLYFDAKPTEEEVKEACRNTKLSLGVDPEDEWFGWGEYPNKVSEAAKMVRVQAFPAC